jgi:hypothetical protein
MKECKHERMDKHDTGIFTYHWCKDCGKTLYMTDTERKVIE